MAGLLFVADATNDSWRPRSRSPCSRYLPERHRRRPPVPDYLRAITLRDRFQGSLNVPEQVQWIRNTNRFWYRKTVPGGNAFVLVNADTQTKEPAFDHAKLADALAAAMKAEVHAGHPAIHDLQLRGRRSSDRILADWRDAGGARETRRGWPMWRCALDSYTCQGSRKPGAGRGGRGGGLDRARAGAVRHQWRGTAEVARRQARGARQQLQRRRFARSAPAH